MWDGLKPPDMGGIDGTFRIHLKVGQEELGPLLTEIEGFLSKILNSSLVMFDDICKRKFLIAGTSETSLNFFEHL